MQAVPEPKPRLEPKSRLERKAQPEPEPLPGSVAQGLSSPRSRTNSNQPGGQGSDDALGSYGTEQKRQKH